MWSGTLPGLSAEQAHTYEDMAASQGSVPVYSGGSSAAANHALDAFPQGNGQAQRSKSEEIAALG